MQAILNYLDRKNLDYKVAKQNNSDKIMIFTDGCIIKTRGYIEHYHSDKAKTRYNFGSDRLTIIEK